MLDDATEITADYRIGPNGFSRSVLIQMHLSTLTLLCWIY